MALVVKDRVQETSSTTGTGTLTLSGAATGYQSFSSAIGNGNTTYYAISSGSDWEVGVGTVGAGTLSRDTVLESSNAGSLVDFAVGVKTVFCTYPAERSVNTQDIGVSIQAYDADTAKYDDATANFVGTLQNGGSNVVVDSDIGSTVQAYDSTILKSANIGVTVQGYDADTAKYDDTTANFTGTLQKSGSNVLTASNIGSTVQAYDADTAKYDDTTANFSGTLQNGGSNVVVDTDIGSTVQAYDADTTKNDVSNTFTANQIISVTDDTNAALRVTQLGNGAAIRVEDETNPDSTPFIVTGDGRVGIGNPSPTNALDITAQEPFVKIYTPSAGYSAFYQATNQEGTFYAGKDRNGSAGLFGSGGQYVIAGSGNYPMDFYTNNSKRMTIDSSGNVGIGTSAPDIRLDVTGGNATIRGDGSLAFINLVNTFNAGYFSYSTAAGNTFDMQNVLSGPIRFYTNNTYRAAISSTGDFLFNSGYGSVATAYGCRAWVNFNGTAASNLTGTYSQTGTTVTVTITGHGYVTGNSAYLDFTSGTAVDGAYTVTVIDANTFTVTQASRTTSGNVTNRRNTIRASGNVSSISDNGTGLYTVNFTTAMSDANYASNVDVAYGTSANGSTIEGSKTTTSVGARSFNSGGTATDSPEVCVIIHR